MSTRRHFLKTALVVSTCYPLPLPAAGDRAKNIRIGMIADIHKDLVPDADERLQAFMETMNKEKPDAVMQLGDFCQPRPGNRAFADLFNSFAGRKIHVIGNHDMDGGFSREQVTAFWGSKDRYYSFDLGGCHFIVLDANDKPAGWKGGYPHYIGADQVEWLKLDLKKTRLNTFVFSHQSLERPTCIDNQNTVRAVLEAARMHDGKRKVAACFNGHWHIDHKRVINGIPYIHVNSASYYYMPSNWKGKNVDPILARKAPLFASSAGYMKPLFTILEIDLAAGKFSMRGMKSEWLGASPQELNYNSTEVQNEWLRAEITPVHETFGKA